MKMLICDDGFFRNVTFFSNNRFDFQRTQTRRRVFIIVVRSRMTGAVSAILVKTGTFLSTYFKIPVLLQIT